MGPTFLETNLVGLDTQKFRKHWFKRFVVSTISDLWHSNLYKPQLTIKTKYFPKRWKYFYLTRHWRVWGSRIATCSPTWRPRSGQGWGGGWMLKIYCPVWGWSYPSWCWSGPSCSWSSLSCSWRGPSCPVDSVVIDVGVINVVADFGFVDGLAVAAFAEIVHGHLFS